jgi:peptidoglycan/xylan/chitin deacetylase (PgdA/CDA1 family)
VNFRKAILAVDELLAVLCLLVTKEQGSLLGLLVHGMFESAEEAKSGLLDPQQGFTVEMLRTFIGHFKREGYRFISPEDLTRGLWNRGRYILLTFDDGYYNNIRALPVLEESGVPAVFFISTDHVTQGKAFWWDVVFREGRRSGKTENEIRRIVDGYKRLKTEEVESELKKEFGKEALRPVGDLDRPFTPGELREFAGHPLVSLGNHTKNHAILTNYSVAEVREQIQGSQEAIEQMTGQTPEMISYPNGNSSPEIQQAAREAGLKIGVGVRSGKNRLPLESGAPAAMILKRFILWGDSGIEAQCRVASSALSLSRLLSGFAPQTGARKSKGSLRERHGENFLAIRVSGRKVKRSGGVGTNH